MLPLHLLITSTVDDSGESSGALIKSIAQAKAHLFMLCDAEWNFLKDCGWETVRNPGVPGGDVFLAGPIVLGTR